MRDDLPTPGPMPEAVRVRLLALVADVLPEVADLPTPLRKVATFAAARRARLGGTLIASHLESDADFRRHVATQVAVVLPALSAAVVSGASPQAADPVELAVVLWLNRPEGWVTDYEAATTRIVALSEPRDTDRITRLEARLEQSESAARQARIEHKAQVESMKSENSTLRRKLGEARNLLRSTAAQAEGAIAGAEESRVRAESAQVGAEAEVRRLKGQLEIAQAAVAAARRESRSERDATTLRARLLLDTLLDAGQGLRRELGLPAVTGSPGDQIETELAAAGTRTPSAAGAMGPASPALLEQLLMMPRARLIIDGYNVSKTAWPESTLEAQRIRLLNSLGALVARTGAETTVVFDAASQTIRGIANAPRGVKVLFSPEGVIADDVIRDLVSAEPQGRVVVVVTSDREVIGDVRRDGARAMWSAALVGLITR